MSRKTLSWIVGGLGMIVAFATLIGMSIMGSVLADARTENIAGPGVDLFLRTPFPTPGSEVAVEVEARGGSRTGLVRARALDGEQLLAEREGAGATWGYTIVEGKTRGSAVETLQFALPARLAAGDTLHLTVDVEYVCAMSSGTHFTNERRHDTVMLDVPVLASAGPARLLLIVRALGLFLLWLGLVWGVTWLFVNSTGGGADGEMEGIGLLMGLMGGGMLGYWFFARALMAAAETPATVWAVLWTALWIALPLWLAWRWAKRQPKLSRYRLHGDGRTVELDAREITLPTAVGTEVQRKDNLLIVKRGDAELRVRWSGDRVGVAELDLRATGVRLPLELAHRAAGKVGKLVLAPSSGPVLVVDPARTIDEIERDYSTAMMAEAQRLIEALQQRLRARR
jgi:hypothetical protein